MMKLLIAWVALATTTVSLAEAVDDGRFDLHGRPAPMAGVRRERPKGEWAKDTQSYPTSIGGNKSYEYISSFVVDVTEDGYYKVMVKVVCPKLYNSDGTYPSYSGEAEFMNVWIDWNADFSWDSSERVLAMEVTDYDDVLANNRIIYYRATVKPQATASGIVKARAMLGWGYNPSDPTTYSWSWGDVKDVSVNLGCEPPRIYSVAIGQYADSAPLGLSKNAKAKADDKGINKNNSVLAGTSAPFYPYILIRKQDRESGHFFYSARLESDAFEKPIAFQIAATTPYYVTHAGTVYGYYSSNAQITVPTKTTIKPSDYGKKKGTLIVNYTSANMGLSQIREDFDFYVFFKHDKDVRLTSSGNVVPMWYAMWGRIISGLNKFSYDQSILAKKEAGECSSAIKPPPYISGTVGDPFTVIGWNFDLKISSAALKIENEFDIGFNGGTFTQSKVDYAIDSVARTVQHELKHKEVYEAVTSARFIGFKSDGKPKFCSALDEEVECKDANGNWIEGDWLIAQREATYDTSVNLRDTYLISNKSGWQSYAGHGDQEYWVRRQVDEVRATEEQRDADWSNLGRNWQKALGNINAGGKSSRSASESVSATLSDEQYQKVLEEKECLFTGAPDVSFESAAVETTSDYVTRGLSFRHGVSLVDAGTYAFTAYLTDVQGKPLAYATVGGEYPSGASTVEFVFDANTMAHAQAASSSRQYRLDLVACQAVESDVGGRSYSAQGLCTTADYSGQVCESSEWFVMGSPTDKQTDDGLMVTVPLWIPEEGDYSLKLVVGLENELTTVSDVLVSGHYARGAHNVGFLVPNSDVYAAKHNGKFRASSLRISTEGGSEGELLFQDLEYDTVEYDYADFCPAEQQVMIDPSTIELNLVAGKDGTVGYSGVQARFSARTTLPSSSQLYRFSARLADASGTVVALASENLIMMNSTDQYSLFFSGLDIKDSGSSGPFTLKYIGIYDEVNGQMMDEYKAAEAKSGDCDVGEFQDGLEVDESAMTVEPVMKGNLISALHVTAPVTAPSSGLVTGSAVLMGANGTEIGRAESVIRFDVAGQQTVALDFAGTDVYASAINGPYTVAGITFTHSSFPEHPYLAAKTLQTAAYSWRDFDNEGVPSHTDLAFAPDEERGDDDGFGLCDADGRPLKSFVQGETVYLYANFRNAMAGEGLDDRFKVAFAWSEEDAVTETCPGLEADEVGKILVPAPRAFQSLPPGKYTLTCTLDSEGAYAETDEKNNVGEMSFSVIARGLIKPGTARPFTTDASKDYAIRSAVTYGGYLLDEKKKLIGVINVKLSKPSKIGACAVSGSVSMLGEKKASLKMPRGVKGTSTGKIDMMAGTQTVALEITADTIGGKLGKNTILGVRTDIDGVDALKDRIHTLALGTQKASGSAAALAAGYSGLSLVGGKKGKVKVSGIIGDGTKVSTTAQLLPGDGVLCIPVLAQLYNKKTGGFGFLVWIEQNGKVKVDSVSDWNAEASKLPFAATFLADVPICELTKDIPGSAFFAIKGKGIESVGGLPVYPTLLPTKVPVSNTGSKWIVDKADKVTAVGGVVQSGRNPSGLTLSYNRKTGAFKGKFSVYADKQGKLKKNATSVNGVVVDGKGYGTAVIKKTGSMPVTVK